MSIQNKWFEKTKNHTLGCHEEVCFWCNAFSTFVADNKDKERDLFLVRVTDEELDNLHHDDIERNLPNGDRIVITRSTE